MRINISVRHRLIFGFSLLTVFILAITIVGITKLAATGRAMSSITQDRVEKMLIVDELLTNNMENGRNARDFLLAKDAEERNRIKDSIKKIRGSNGELGKRLEALSVSSEEKALLGSIATARKAAGGSFDKFVSMAEVNAEQARSEAMGSYLTANEQAKSAIIDYRKFQLDQMRATVEKAHQEYQRSRTLMIGLLVIAVVAGMVVATWISRSVARPLARLRAAMADVGKDNDFTRQIQVTSHDEVGQTAVAFNALLATLRDSLSELRGCIVDVNGSVGALASASQQAANASTQSSESASAMAAAVEEMSVSISSVSDSTRDALTMAKSAEGHSNDGGEIIGDAVNEVRRIVTMVDDVSKNITELSQNSNRISGIVQVISEVAEQTNLLALNAAIEAARAGESGRGFAVVADEVRKLAERTTKATSEISDMIRAIQASSDSAASSIVTAVDQVEKGAELAEKAGGAITSIRESNNHVLDAVNRINDAMREQNSASQEIARRVESVARSSEESANSVQMSAETTQRIYTLAEQMRKTVERFKV